MLGLQNLKMALWRPS